MESDIFGIRSVTFLPEKQIEVSQKLNKIQLGVQFIALHMPNKRRSLNKFTCRNVATAVSAIVFQTSRLFGSIQNYKICFFSFQ